MSAIFFLRSTDQCIGQDLTTLCTEATAKQLQKEGIFITAKSFEPGNNAVWIQYRKVLKIEKVAMGSDGGEPIYYLVHYGPESSYKYWHKGMSPPWTISGEYWVEKGTQGWNGIWVRQGTSNVYNVSWKKGSTQVNATVSFTISGNQWTGKRISSSDGVICQYFGTLSADGSTISGNGNCDNGGTFTWTATISK